MRTTTTTADVAATPEVASPAHTHYYTVPDVAAHLSLSVRTVQRMIAAGEIPAVKMGRSYRIAEGYTITPATTTATASKADEGVVIPFPSLDAVEPAPAPKTDRKMNLPKRKRNGKAEPIEPVITTAERFPEELVRVQQANRTRFGRAMSPWDFVA